jgi:hypothetical protein
MHTIETTIPMEAQRCRRAQYSGQVAKVVIGGTVLIGRVMSVKEDRFGEAPRWHITIAEGRGTGN